MGESDGTAKRVFILGAGLIAICGAIYLAWYATIIAPARNAVARGLKDPASVQFDQVGLAARGPIGDVCGKFNAKNSYGGYVGFRRFFYSRGDGTATVESEGNPDSADAKLASILIRASCD